MSSQSSPSSSSKNKESSTSRQLKIVSDDAKLDWYQQSSFFQHPLVHVNHKHGHKRERGRGRVGPLFWPRPLVRYTQNQRKNYIRGWLPISCHTAGKYRQSSRLPVILINTNNSLNFFRTQCRNSSPHPWVTSDQVCLYKVMALPTVEPWLRHWKYTATRRPQGKQLDP